MNSTPGLFDEFAAAESALVVDRQHHGQHIKAVALARRTTRMTLRRAKSEAVLAEMKIARNHAKVMAGSHAASGTWFAIESSANINTNPRIEQTAIHMDRALHDHYCEFYAGIKSIDGRRYKKKAAA